MNNESAIIELGEVQTIPRHAHHGLEIFFLLKGLVELDLDGVIFSMRQDDIIVCSPGRAHGARGIEPNTMFRLVLSEAYLAKEIGEYEILIQCNSCIDHEEQQVQKYVQLRRIFTSLMFTYYQENKQQSLEIKSALLQILILLLTHFQNENANASDVDRNERVDLVIRYIRKNYRNEITLQLAANHAHISAQYLSRLFKRKMKIGFMEYVNQVRLEGAVSDLLRTNESILKIAMNNGFSNVGSFNRLFQRLYSETPAKYRSARQITHVQPSSGTELNEVFNEKKDLIKYLRQFDTKHQFSTGERNLFNIDCNAAAIKKYKMPDKIIMVGRINELLKAEIREQLQHLKQECNIDYVHFIGIFNDGMYRYSGVTYAKYEYILALDFLHETNLKPFIQLKIGDMLQYTESAPLENATTWVAAFLQMAINRYSSAYLSQWRFEIAYPVGIDRNVMLTFYKAIYQTIRTILPNACISFQFVDSESRIQSDSAALITFLQDCEKAEISPTALTYYIKRAEHAEWAENKDYNHYRHYNSRRLHHIMQCFEENGLVKPQVNLMRWNVLSGFTTAESNAFYRSAIFMDEILNLDNCVTGVSFWLNNYVHESATGKDDFDVPAMFLINRIKRPIYFAVTLLDLLRGDIIYSEPNVIVTREDEHNLAILIMNPCYFNPRNALDQSFVIGERMNFTLQIKNMKKEKRIERYYMSKRQSAIYDSWADMGFPSILDKKVTEQISKIVNIHYSIYGEDNADTCKLSMSLDFNEAAVIRIQSKN